MSNETAVATRPPQQPPLALRDGAPAHVAPPVVVAPDYTGLAVEPFSDVACKVLMRPVTDDEVEIRAHDGLIYLPGVRFRQRLNEAFKPGGWALRPIDLKLQGATVCYRGQLWVLGRFVSESIGEAKYVANNPQTSYASAIESAKTDCLTRCCKDLGIASQLWEPSFSRRWVSTHAVQLKQCQRRCFGSCQHWARKDASFTPPRDDAPEDQIPEWTAPPPPPANQPPDDARPITDAQRKRMFAIAREAGHTNESIHEWLLNVYGYASTKDIATDKYDEICVRLTDQSPLEWLEVGDAG